MIAALAALAVAGNYYSPFLMPRADIAGVAEPGCDLQLRPCAAQIPGGGRIELSITPRPIPFLQPLRLEVTTTGIDAGSITVDFAGESMNMGFNRSTLTDAGSGRHAGEASLPVCVTGRMAWIATVLIETDRQRIVVPYRFTVGH